MIVSILKRHTRLTEHAVWEAALGTALPQILQVLAEQPGFVAVQYLWGIDEPGRTAQITTWRSEGDCRNYVRGGGAATVATIEDAAVPTAAHPKGSWNRETFSVAEA
jgi:heme-degrading monooxygenase HmoA